MSGNYENQLMSSASFEVHYKMDKDFKTVEMHSHDFFEVYCFLRGSASYIIEECKYTLLPGDILLIPQGKLHQLDIKDSTETYERYVLWINTKYIKKISSQKTDLRTCFECALKSKSFLIRNGAISQKIRRLLESITLSKEDAFGTDVENEERIKSLLVTLAQFFCKTTKQLLHTERPTPACAAQSTKSHEISTKTFHSTPLPTHFSSTNITLRTSLRKPRALRRIAISSKKDWCCQNNFSKKDIPQPKCIKNAVSQTIHTFSVRSKTNSESHRNNL